MRASFQPRFPRFYRKRSGDRDVSARATHLKAATENVSVTTIERKQMSTKTTFKRVALGLVAALGLGVLASGPSNAYVTNSVSFTASSSSATVNAGETATTTLTLQYTSTLKWESLTVKMNSDAANVSRKLVVQRADSINVLADATGGDSATAIGVQTTGSSGVKCVSNASGTSATTVKCVIQAQWLAANNATPGTYYDVVALYSDPASSSPISTVPFTLTVAAKDLTATAAKSLMWINGASSEGNLCASGCLLAGETRNADSALVVSANTALPNAAQDFTNVKAVIHWDPRNAADTNLVGGEGVTGDLVVNITGAGQIADAAGTGTKSNQVTLSAGETAVVFSNGVAGAATITGRIGNVALTQAAKTITFYGKATSLVASTGAWDDFGGNLGYGADSANTGIVTFVAKDANGTVVKSAAMQNSLGNFYVISSDTKIASANARALYTTCAISVASTGTWSCDFNTNDSGTATLTIADSTTVAGAGVSSNAVSITVAGAAYTATVAFDKKTYQPNEKAIITVTVKDRAGRNIKDVNGAAISSAQLFTTIKAGDDIQNKPFSNYVTNYGFGSALTGLSWDWSGNRTVFGGVETFVVYMPSTSGKVSIRNLGTSYESSTSYTAILAEATVIDAAEEAASSALDAAQEATDAAIAATDAAVLAQESADAAAVAAEAAAETAAEAAEAAKAAVTAVTALSAEVTKLLTQLATLQKLMNRIAKKVGVKV